LVDLGGIEPGPNFLLDDGFVCFMVITSHEEEVNGGSWWGSRGFFGIESLEADGK